MLLDPVDKLLSTSLPIAILKVPLADPPNAIPPIETLDNTLLLPLPMLTELTFK